MLHNILFRKDLIHSAPVNIITSRIKKERLKFTLRTNLIVASSIASFYFGVCSSNDQSKLIQEPKA